MRLLLTILFCGLLVQSAARPDPGSNCTVRHFGVEEGLIHRRVHQVVQDQQGFLWLATPGGVQRFDGYGFRTYTTEEGLTTNAVNMIWPDADGLLWLVSKSTYTEGQVTSIDILDPSTGQVTSYKEHFGSEIPCPLEDMVGKALVLNDGTLLLSAKGRMVHYRGRGEERIVLPIATEDLLRPIVFTGDSMIWCVRLVRNKEFLDLVKVDRMGNVHRVPIPAMRFVQTDLVEGCDLSSDEERCYYMIAEQEVGGMAELRIDGAGALRVLASRIPKDLKFQLAGVFYLDLGDGRVLVDASVREAIPEASPRGSPVLLDLQQDYPEIISGLHNALQDRNGNVWLCGDFGLWELTMRPALFQRWLQHTDTMLGTGRSIRGMILLDGVLHANTERHGWWTLDTRTGEATRMDDGQEELRYGIAPDGKGGFFANASSTILHWRHGRTIASLPVGQFTFCFAPLADGRLLLGTNRGLAWSDTALIHYSGYDHGGHAALAASTVTHIFMDRKGTIWVSTSQGLAEIDAEGTLLNVWSRKDSLHYLPAQDFRHVYEAPDGVFWLSTATSGLLRWDRSTGDVRSITRRNGLPSNGIYAAYPDANGNLWLTTDQGIVRYDPHAGQIKTFTTANGIAHNEFNRLAHLRGPDGRFYFGGLNGITVFHPNDEIERQPPAPLVIAYAEQLDGRSGELIDRTAEVMRGRVITIYPEDRFLTLRMALLSFEKPADIMYAWRIDGIDADWNHQRDPELRLMSLPFGTHQLHIRAKGGSGDWNEQELALTIHVVRPWYLRWWALALFALALIAGTTLLFRIRLARAREMMAMRDRIALDLHDEVGSTLSSVALFSTALRNTSTTHSRKESTMLDRIAENSAQAMESMNDIVWSVNTRYEKLADVEDRMLAYAGPLAEACGWELEIDVEEGLRDRRLGMNERKNLYLVFKEAVNNAAKHAHCDRVTIRVRRQGQDIELSITDNGAGLSSGIHGRNGLGGNGLRGMQARAEAIGGSLTIAQQQPGGTIITLRFTPHPGH